MVLIWPDLDDLVYADDDVSVPLRGLWFLSTANPTIRTGMNWSFRPLAGIMVLIDLEALEMCYDDVQFPSPCGDYGSYHLESCNDWEWKRQVSVPLRGLWFLSTHLIISMKRCLKTFPSPCGDYGSYPDLGLNPNNDGKIIVSVPLRGLWFLSAPFINAFMKPSKWHFAERIIYFHHFLSFAGK